MKTPRLLASFAVAATVSAADLKEPLDVARAWDENSTPTRPLTEDLSLRGISTLPPREFTPPPQLPVLQEKPKDQAHVPSWGKPAPHLPAPGAPGSRSAEALSDSMPPGAREWKYGGQTYWLLPLIPSREK